MPREYMRWFGLICCVILLYVAPTGSETLTLTTYYPAPYAAYVKMRIPGNANLAVNEDRVFVGVRYPNAVKSGLDADPAASGTRLYVNGKIRMAQPTQPTDSGDTIVTKGFVQLVSVYSHVLWPAIAAYNAGCNLASANTLYCASACNRYCAAYLYVAGTATEARTDVIGCSCWK